MGIQIPPGLICQAIVALTPETDMQTTREVFALLTPAPHVKTNSDFETIPKLALFRQTLQSLRLQSNVLNMLAPINFRLN